MTSVVLVGRLATEPDLRYFGSKDGDQGTALCRFRIMVRQGFGARRRGHFFTVRCWGKVGEVVGERCGKGMLVCVEGKLEEDEWEGKDGRKRTEVLVKAELVHFLDRAEGTAADGGVSGDAGELAGVERKGEAEAEAAEATGADPFEDQ